MEPAGAEWCNDASGLRPVRALAARQEGGAVTGARQMVWRLAGAVALALLVMAGCSALTPGPPGETPRSASPAPVALPGPPMAGASTWVLAVISDAPTVLARLDPRSLRPLPGRRVDLGEPVAGYALSADRSLLVLGDNDEATLFVVDVVGMRLAGRVLLEPGGPPPDVLAWLGPRRVAAVTEDAGGVSVVLVDPLARRVVARQRLGGVLGGTARLPGRLVLLLTPDGAIGPARLAVVDGRGTVRSVTLPGIVAGFAQPAAGAPDAVGRQRVAGLAVDASGGRAFVVAAGGPVAEVDLASLRVTDHVPRQPAGLLGRLAGWLVPPAQAKAVVSGPVRQACWLGDGLLAVAGSEDRVRKDPGGQLQDEQVPSGALLLDTRSWTVQPLDTQASQVSYRGGWLLTFGGGWNAAEQRSYGAGLTAYGPGGRPPLHLFRTRLVFDALVDGDLAYAWLTEGNGDTATAIADLRTGRVLRVLAGPAAPLYLLPGEDDSRC
jgi:hypothetical protein